MFLAEAASSQLQLMLSHDPQEYIRGIQQILVSDKKRIGFLFGAGSSVFPTLPMAHIPAVGEMTSTIIDQIGKADPLLGKAIEAIKPEIRESDFNLETLLSRIESKREVVGTGTLNELNIAGFDKLSTAIKDAIVELVSVHARMEDKDIQTLHHMRFSNWIAKANRRYPVEIFTTNYDFLFEIGLERFGIPYFDGFSGSYEPFFCSDAVEDVAAYGALVKLWKMHGSLGWSYREADRSVIRNRTAAKLPILIYPSHLKYTDTKKQPYIALIDRLCSFLQQDDAVLITCGYSFGDNHINERVATSLRRGYNSTVLALFYDEYRKEEQPAFRLAEENNKLLRLATRETAGKLSVYGRRHAVIGGRLGEWRVRNRPATDELERITGYFSLDPQAAAPAGDSGESPWAGTGTLQLPEFGKLSSFLNSLAPEPVA